MPANFRPQGVLCNNYIYNDGTKESPYARLKRFLFEQDSGRTDVIFFSSAASALEPQINLDNPTSPESYHCTGGLIDGIAKAIIQGNANIGRPSRSLYATGVRLAYESNVVPGYDAWNSNTWSTPNTTGAGSFLTGCSVAYDSYFYYTLGAFQQTGFLNYSLPKLAVNNDTQQIQWDPVNETNTFYSWRDFIGSSFLPLEEVVTNNTPKDVKIQYYYQQMGKAPITALSTDIKYFDTTNIIPVDLSQMPEQPQRFWDDLQPFLQDQDSVFEVGIGFIKNGVVESLLGTHSSYIPAGLTVGQTESQVLSSFPNSIRLSTTLEDSFASWDQWLGSLGQMGTQSTVWIGAGKTAAERQNDRSFFSALFGRKIIIRKITTNELITLRGLNILSSPPANKAAYEASDGYRRDNNVVFRWMWANPPTISNPDLSPLVTKWIQTLNLALSSVDASVSPEQNNLPYAKTFGIKSHLFSTNAMHSTQWASRVGALVSNLSETQLLGFPITLSSVNPAGFFALTKLDTPNLTGGSATIFKDRCFLIRPNLGLFHDAIVPSKGGLSPTTKELTTAEKNNLLGIFKSPNFLYVATVYTIPSYSGNGTNFPERKSNVSPITSSQVVFTAHEKTIGNGNILTQIRNPHLENAFGGNGQVIPFTTEPAEAVPRNVNRQPFALRCNLQTTNNNWTKSEFRFGFLGKGSNNVTAGTLLIGCHYGIDRDNAHGIAFTKMETSYKFRSGDIGYNFDNGISRRGALYLEVFRTIRDRQAGGTVFSDTGGTDQDSSEINTTKKRKLVIFYETGIWELANPNESYNGFNTYEYLQSGYATGNPPLPFPEGKLYTSGAGTDAIAPLTNLLKIAGWNEDEYVIVFYTPSHLTSTSSNSINSNTNPQSWTTDINKRSTFQRASEIFLNTILNGKGLYNVIDSGKPLPTSTTGTRIAHSNSCYINLGSIPTINATLDAPNILPTNDEWYVSNGEDTYYNQYTAAGSLAIGSMFLDYMYSATNPSVNFVPPWIPPFSKMLKYTTDPVSGADLVFTTISTDRLDIEPYLVELDAIIDNQNNAANDQATRTLCYYKTKTLQ